MKKIFLVFGFLILSIHFSSGQEIQPYRVGIVVEDLKNHPPGTPEFLMWKPTWKCPTRNMTA